MDEGYRLSDRKYIVDLKMDDSETVEIRMRSTGWLQVANLEIEELLGTMRYVLKMCFGNSRSRFVEIIPGKAFKSALGPKFQKIQNLVNSYNNDIGDLQKDPTKLNEINGKWT